MNINRKFPHYFWTAIDVIFPPNCAGCGVAGTRWCDICQSSTPKVSPQHCSDCGRPGEQGELCKHCENEPFSFTACRSWGMHRGPLREAVLKLKYRRDLGLGEIMAKNLADVVKENDWQFDLISPIPLGKRRLKERGYNQAGLLARPLAWELKIDYLPKNIKRIRETTSQVDLNRGERIENVEGAFWANPKRLGGKRILIVDDVMTTGATVNAVSKAALSAGAEKVYVVTLSRAG